MKKTFTLFSFLMFGAGAHAQLTQANTAPANGDTYTLYQCDSLNINPGGGGSGLTWNYASIVTHSSVQYAHTCSNTSSPSYPQANVVVNAGASNASYYKSSATSLDYYGGNLNVGTSVAATLTYTTPLMRTVYPMSLNSTTTTPIGGGISITVPLSTSGNFTGTGAVIADANGTLTLPGPVVFNNVLRLMTNQAYSFTTSLMPTTPSSVTELRWDWYAPGIKNAVFSIITTTAITPLGTNTQTLVFRDKNVGVGLTEPGDFSAAISLYPNPANEVLYINDLSGKAEKVELSDMQGRLVLSAKTNSETTALDIELLSQGIYVCKVLDKKGTLLRSIKVAKE